MINSILVISQAAASFIFLVRYTMLVKWWKTISGQVLGGLLICLFTITFTLSITESNEGLGSSPLAVTLGRFGFAVVATYGIIALELRARRRRKYPPCPYFDRLSTGNDVEDGIVEAEQEALRYSREEGYTGD